MNAIETVETPDLKSGLPRLVPGDTVEVTIADSRREVLILPTL